MMVEGKVAIVTGASRGAGRATAMAFARAGCHVVINHRQSAAEADDAVEEVRRFGAKAVAFAADVSQDHACRELAQVATREFGRIDILVNNAATTRFIAHSDLEAVKAEDWQRIMAVNVMGPFQCIRAVLPQLQDSGNGEVVNVASVAGLSSPGSSIPYGASKAGLINMTVNLARALAPRIRVNAVAPGFIETGWHRERLGDRYEKVKSQIERSAPLERVCSPEDVAAAILGIVTGSDMVTGQTLVVDGGRSFGPRVS